jgi:hypothetical protein
VIARLSASFECQARRAGFTSTRILPQHSFRITKRTFDMKKRPSYCGRVPSSSFPPLLAVGVALRTLHQWR